MLFFVRHKSPHIRIPESDHYKYCVGRRAANNYREHPNQHPCKSCVKEKKILLTRASEERARRTLAEPAARTCASRRWFLPSQNRTSIHCLRPLRTVTED